MDVRNLLLNNLRGHPGRIHEYAAGFCHPAKASLAVGRIKRAVQSGLEMSFEQGLALERELQAGLFASADARPSPASAKANVRANSDQRLARM